MRILVLYKHKNITHENVIFNVGIQMKMNMIAFVVRENCKISHSIKTVERVKRDSINARGIHNFGFFSEIICFHWTLEILQVRSQHSIWQTATKKKLFTHL